jgi:hypothetical protein
MTWALAIEQKIEILTGVEQTAKIRPLVCTLVFAICKASEREEKDGA